MNIYQNPGSEQEKKMGHGYGKTVHPCYSQTGLKADPLILANVPSLRREMVGNGKMKTVLYNWHTFVAKVRLFPLC